MCGRQVVVGRLMDKKYDKSMVMKLWHISKNLRFNYLELKNHQPHADVS